MTKVKFNLYLQVVLHKDSKPPPLSTSLFFNKSSALDRETDSEICQIKRNSNHLNVVKFFSLLFKSFIGFK